MRVSDDIFGDVAAAAGNGNRLPAERLCEAERVGDAIALLLGELQAALGLDIERGPRGMETIGETLRVAHKPGGARVLADADEEPLAGSPRTRDRPRLQLAEQLLIDALCRAPERELAERRQVGGGEKVLECTLGLLGNVDLAVP